ncbi:MAG: hypothetical protein AMXMBFR84_18830 [Candidatus Hydrogenedentota bacterium]
MRTLLFCFVLLCASTGLAGADTLFEWDEQSQIEDGVVWMELPANTAANAAAGLAWRVQDSENYYLAVYLGDEDLLAIFAVKGGEEELLRAEVAKLQKGQNLLEIRYTGDLATAYLNKKQVMVVKDDSITKAGGIGWVADVESAEDAPNLRIAEWEPESKKIVAVDTETIEWETAESYDYSYYEEVSVSVVEEMSEEWSVEEQTIVAEEESSYESFEAIEEYESYEEEFESEEMEEEEEEVMEESDVDESEEESDNADDGGDEDEDADDEGGDEGEADEGGDEGGEE